MCVSNERLPPAQEESTTKLVIASEKVDLTQSLRKETETKEVIGAEKVDTTQSINMESNLSMITKPPPEIIAPIQKVKPKTLL